MIDLPFRPRLRPRTPFPGRLAALLVLVVSPVPGWSLQAVGQETAPLPPVQEPQAAGLLTAPVDEPGSDLRVWLVTMGQGDAVWERFGHNAIRIVDAGRGTDLSYNWGIFDFQQVDFIPRFLKGQMLYMMAPFPTGRMLESYVATDREVVMQELDLTPAERVELQDFVEWNALPENRDYFYDYFLDNCSTRVRDVLDRVLGGQLAGQFQGMPTGTSYRTHTRRLTQVDPFLFTGMDLLLGSPGDRPISVWEEMFVPMTLRDALRDVRITDADGIERPLVLSEEIVHTSTRPPEAPAPPRWWGVYLGLGVLVGGLLLFTGVGRRAPGRDAEVAAPGIRTLFGGVALAWSALAGVAGLILVAVLFTDHHFMYWNENLLQFSPLSLVVAALLPVAAVRGWASPLLVQLAWAVVILSGLGVGIRLLPLTPQDNTILILLALPIHLGLALGVTRIRAGRRTGRAA